MNAIDSIVIVLGVGAIIWVNWYFFLAGRAAPVVAARSVAMAEGAAASIPEVTITVQGGYSPNAIRVAAGRPVRLIFDRRDNSSCSEEVVFPDFGIRKFLPTGERTAIDITVPKAGTYDFMCGMSMLRGKLIAE
jgi:plastocyanin domain-containing protein